MKKIMNPKVSVCIVTYNQKEYIQQCLESIIDQKTNFDFEVIVSDDCSSDGTIEIIKEFEYKYPNKIYLIRHERNIGALKNFRFVHEQARGAYIAHLDGDDYALPGKLQTQADYLDANPDCNITFHRVIVVADQKKIDSYLFDAEVTNKKFYRKDIINLVAIGAHSSKMYRVLDAAGELPKFDIVDYTANVIHVGDGYAAYCSEKPLGVYRKGIGISGSSKVIESVLKTLLYFKRRYPEHMCEINSSALGWLASNIKNKRPFVLEFLRLAISTLSICGVIKFIKKRFILSEVK